MQESGGRDWSPKIYVDVAALFTRDGRLRPLWIVWQDGRRFPIDRVKSCQRAASRRAGGVGLRYTCLCCGREIHLYYEENYRWFVEGRG